MNARTLVLTAGYFPFTIVDWKTAVTLLYLGKAEVVSSYDEEIRSPSTALKSPAVIRLRKQVRTTKRNVKFSRINVYVRDDFTCAYCGAKLPMSKLTYDHVLPRARGGRTVWTNILTACYDCNAKKGASTLAEAGMRPQRRAYQPLELPLHAPVVDPGSAPDEWRDYTAAMRHR